MTKQRFLMGLIAFPFPARWLPAVAFGITAGAATFLLYLAAVRGL